MDSRDLFLNSFGDKIRKKKSIVIKINMYSSIKVETPKERAVCLVLCNISSLMSLVVFLDSQLVDLTICPCMQLWANHWQPTAFLTTHS